MNDLEMIKAFAELDGVEVQQLFGDKLYRGVDHTLYEYNPITDLALNCAARDKYKITIFYYPKGVIAACYRDISVKVEKKFASKAVIECILKSEGLWK